MSIADAWTTIVSALPTGWGMTMTVEVDGACVVLRSPEWSCATWEAGDSIRHDITGVSIVQRAPTAIEAFDMALAQIQRMDET